MKTIKEHVLTLTDEAFNKKSFNGSNVVSTLDNMTVKQALYVPKGQKRCAWEIALHLTYWKHYLAVMLDGTEEDSPYDFEKTDWPALPDIPNQEAWDRLKEVMDRVQNYYRGAVEHSDESKWDQKVGDWDSTWEDTLISMPSHDIYHTAQIRNMGIPDFEGDK